MPADKGYDVSARFKEVAKRAREQGFSPGTKPREAAPTPPSVETRAAAHIDNPRARRAFLGEAEPGSLPDLPPTPRSIRPHEPPRAPDRGEAIRRLMASLTR